MAQVPGITPSLPPELIDAVANEILLCQHLLPFSLTSHAVRDTVQPHLQNRYVECSVRDGEMWDCLEEVPKMRQAVRFLKLREWPESSRVPTLPFTSYQSNRRLLPSSLLAKMTDLHAFTWLDGILPRNLTGIDTELFLEHLWRALTDLPKLKHVDVAVSCLCTSCATREGINLSCVSACSRFSRHAGKLMILPMTDLRPHWARTPDLLLRLPYNWHTPQRPCLPSHREDAATVAGAAVLIFGFPTTDLRSSQRRGAPSPQGPRLA